MSKTPRRTFKTTDYGRIGSNKLTDYINEWIDEVSHRIADDRLEAFAEALEDYLNSQLDQYFPQVASFMGGESKPSSEIFSDYNWYKLAKSTVNRKGKNSYWVSMEKRINGKRAGETPLRDLLLDGGVSFKDDARFVVRYQGWKDDYGYEQDKMLTIYTPYKFYNRADEMFDFDTDDEEIQRNKISGESPLLIEASNEERRPLFNPVADWFFGKHLQQMVDKFTKKREWRIRVRLTDM